MATAEPGTEVLGVGNVTAIGALIAMLYPVWVMATLLAAVSVNVTLKVSGLPEGVAVVGAPLIFRMLPPPLTVAFRVPLPSETPAPVTTVPSTDHW